MTHRWTSRSRLEHVAAAHAARGHGSVRVGDLAQRHHRVHPGRQVAGRSAGEQHVMCGIKEWAEAHMDEVLANRTEYDTRVA
jgi:hypothetical protein